MTTEAAVLLAQWLSPAFPVGAFSYSHGLERAVEDGLVDGPETLERWLGDVLEFGAGRSDAILITAAFNGADGHELDALSRALAPSKERLMETDLQGAAFGDTVRAVWGGMAGRLTYPVALGQAAVAHDLPLSLTLRMYLHGFVSNLVSAGIRLIPIGQTDGQRVLTALSPLCARIAAEAAECTPSDIASSAFMADVASMKHETQYSRLFRS